MKGKKIMAFLLSVMMIVTMIPLTALGDAGIGDKKEPVQAVEAHKTAKLLPDGETAEITLAVKGKLGTNANIGADVVLVVDNSGSMTDKVQCKNENFNEKVKGLWHTPYYKCSECGKTFDIKPDFCTGYVQRMTVAKKASHSFVEKILQEPSNDNKVAVIPFEWEVPKASWSESRYALNFTTEQGELDNCIDQMKADGGTSYTAALKKTQEFIDARKDKTRPVYIVMMSDGAPGGGQNYIGDKRYNGIDQAQALIQQGVTIYTVGISLSETWEEKAMKAVASKLGEKTLYQNVKNDSLTSDLKGVLEGIAGEVMSSGKNANIVDSINSEDFDIDTLVIPTRYQEKLKQNEPGKLTWDIGTINEDEQSITFTVKLKKESLEQGGAIYTNQGVTLSYIGSDGKEYQQDKEILGHPQVSILGKVAITFKTQSDKGEITGFQKGLDETSPYDYQKIVKGIKGTTLKAILGDSGLPEVTPKEGYVFTGWYTEEVDGTKVEKIDELINSERTLYAHFVGDEYFLHVSHIDAEKKEIEGFNGVKDVMVQHESFAKVMEDNADALTGKDTAQYELNSITMDGVEILSTVSNKKVSWKDMADFQAADTEPSGKPDKNIKVLFGYKKKTHMITFKNADIAAGDLSTEGTKTDDQGKIICEKVPYGTVVNTLLPKTTGKTVENVPYVFDKWTDEAGNQVAFDNQEPILTGNLTYTAHWKEKTEDKVNVIVRYYKTEKSGETLPIKVGEKQLLEQHTAYLGEKIIIKTNEYLTETYFKEDLPCYSQNNTTATNISNEELVKEKDGDYQYIVVKEDKSPNTKDIYIHVIFGMNAYPVTFESDMNGSIVGDKNQTVVHGDAAAMIKALPAEHYAFLKWTKTTTDGTVDVTGGKEDFEAKDIKEKTVFTAHFVLNKYIVTFKAGEYGLLDDEKEDVAFEGILHGVTWSEAIKQLPVIKPHEKNGWIVNSKENWIPLPLKEDTPIIESLTFTARYDPTYTIEYLTLEDYLNDKAPFESKVKEITAGTVLKETEIPQAEVKNIPEGYKKVFIVGIPETEISKPGTVVRVVYDKTSKESTIVPVEKDNVAIVGVRHIVEDGTIPENSTWEEYQLPTNKEVEVNSLYGNLHYAGYKVSKITLVIKNADGTKEGPTEVPKSPVKIANLQPKAEYVVTYVYIKETSSSGGGGGGSTSKGNNSNTTPEGMIPLHSLETDNHFAYILGYPDDKVKPENLISREEVTSIFYRLLKDSVREGFFTTKQVYPDVVEGRWSGNSIATLQKGGIISGYTDGNFKPARFITRAEFATIASKFDNLSVTENDMFSDVSDHWANKYINSATKKGWIHGYPNGTFKPDQNITRAEAMTLINNVLNRRVEKEGILRNAKVWKDAGVDSWYFKEVMEATNSHDYETPDAKSVEKWTKLKENKVWNE